MAKKTPDFETALTELEKIVADLEKGDLNLDKSLDAYKWGVELAKLCNSKLQTAQEAVQQIIDEEGTLAVFSEEE